MKVFYSILMIVLFGFCFSYAQPTTITYQGKLMTNLGLPVNQNNVIVNFAIFDSESGGTKLWPPNFSSSTKQVNISAGLYSVTLGTGVASDEPFEASLFGNSTPWLQVVVDGSPLPRTALTNVPFSLISNQLSDEGWASPGAIGSTAKNSANFTDVNIGTVDINPTATKLQVEGGVLYAGGNQSTSAGLLFYDPSITGSFKYYDNNGTQQVLGTGNISYTGTLWQNISGDYLAATDVISQGSLGVGFDMNAGYNFGFATIAMRENNTRILFEDTSNPPFPTTDWMLVANESASGGQSYFAIQNVTNSTIPFYVHTDAGNNSLIVQNNKIGIGTANPAQNVHTLSGNTPAIRLEQDNSGGFSAQTWDVAGNEAFFFVRDVTNGSNYPFRIRPGAPTNSLNINNDGNIGLGITGSTHPLQLASGAHVTSAGEWTNASDSRLKTNIQKTSYGLVEVMKLNPVSYDMISGNTHHIGFLAQEVSKIIPEVVSGFEGDISKGETLGISYGNLVPVLTKAIQEQQVEIDALKKELQKIKTELASAQTLNEAMLVKFVKLTSKLTELLEDKSNVMKTASK